MRDLKSGDTLPATTVTFWRGETIVVIRAPAAVCTNCGGRTSSRQLGGSSSLPMTQRAPALR
jgi:YgiT-type zinc finger domain-containing protein